MGPGDSPFFVGEAQDGRPLVLQHLRGAPVALTLTGCGEDGTLSCGDCGEREDPFVECLSGP